MAAQGNQTVILNLDMNCGKYHYGFLRIFYLRKFYFPFIDFFPLFCDNTEVYGDLAKTAIS